MARPLELAYNWRLPVTFSTVGLAVSLGVLLPDRGGGTGASVAVLVLLWAAFLALVWLRTRAYLMADGARLHVRSAVTLREVDGSRVAAVRQSRSPHGASYRLTVLSDAAPPRSVLVPTGLLLDGDQALLGWLVSSAPGAVLDAGSQRTLARLRTRGLVQPLPGELC